MIAYSVEVIARIKRVPLFCTIKQGYRFFAPLCIPCTVFFRFTDVYSVSPHNRRHVIDHEGNSLTKVQGEPITVCLLIFGNFKIFVKS